MGFFDFLKSERTLRYERAQKAVANWPPGYKFTATDSFYRFTMGLKAWNEWRKGLGEQHLTEALKWWDECHETYPEDLFPYFMLAMALCADGQREEARKIFDHIGRLDPAGEFGDCSRKNVQALDGKLTIVAPDIIVE